VRKAQTYSALFHGIHHHHQQQQQREHQHLSSLRPHHGAAGHDTSAAGPYSSERLVARINQKPHHAAGGYSSAGLSASISQKQYDADGRYKSMGGYMGLPASISQKPHVADGRYRSMGWNAGLPASISQKPHDTDGGYSSPSSPYISDDEEPDCDVTADDLDLALGRLRSASVDGLAHV